jgi:hypothetical protein
MSKMTQRIYAVFCQPYSSLKEVFVLSLEL